MPTVSGRHRRILRPWWLRSSKAFRRRGLFDRLEILRQDPGGWRDEIAAAEAVEARGGRSPLQVVQAVDCADWLPHDRLTKVDRCLIAHGVEGRTPLLDPAVAAAAFRLPDALKTRGSRGKWLLRRRLAEHLPEARPFARKRGFTVPVPHWIAREGKRLAPLIAAQPGVAEDCRKGTVEALFSDLHCRIEIFMLDYASVSNGWYHEPGVRAVVEWFNAEAGAKSRQARRAFEIDASTAALPVRERIRAAVYGQPRRAVLDRDQGPRVYIHQRTRGPRVSEISTNS